MTRRLDITLAVCVWNDAERLARLLEQARQMRLFAEILVVDDGSDIPVRAPGTRIIRHPACLGIGAARNTAMDAVRSDYLLFADSDDLLLPELPLLLADLAEAAPFDLCLFRHVDSRLSDTGRWGQTEADELLWQSAGHATGTLAEAAPAARPLLARQVNYPWNKVFRTAFLRDNAIRCPEVRVHEDIALHWLSLVRAERMLVSDRAAILHHVRSAGDRLTDRRDAIRLQLFAAMEPVANAFRDATPVWRSAFLANAMLVSDWAETVLAPETRPAFREAESAWFTRLVADWGPPVEPALAERLAPRLNARPAAPAVTGQAMMKVAIFGNHAPITPLAHPWLAPLWQDRIARVSHAAAADLIVITHPHDIGQLPRLTGTTPLALFSEEPFWDSLFSPDPLAATVNLGGRCLHQVNHHTSAIYDFERLPYYLLTDPRMGPALAARFARNAALSADDWRDAFAARPLRALFMAERRPEVFHDIAFPGGDILGLCAFRTRLANAVRGAERLGASWNGGQTRFQSADWHGDKLDRLDGRAMIILAIENTHQPAYVSEKLFDAYACGAMPLYLASPGHRVHRLGLPPGSWLNLHGMDTATAARMIEAWKPDPAFLQGFAAAQSRLAALMADPSVWAAERLRLAGAVTAQVERLLALGPARAAEGRTSESPGLS